MYRQSKEHKESHSINKIDKSLNQNNEEPLYEGSDSVSNKQPNMFRSFQYKQVAHD